MASGTFDITAAAVGDRVQHEFLVVDREEKKQANGDPFVLLTLGNPSGRLGTAPLWSNQLEWASGAERGKVVQVIGEIAAFHGKRQLRITAPLRVLPDSAVRPEHFLPRISVASESLWDWVDRARAEFKSPALRRAVDLFFADDAFRLEFERAPASVAGHHAAVGGLLLHVTEVATIARNAARVMKANAGRCGHTTWAQPASRIPRRDRSWATWCWARSCCRSGCRVYRLPNLAPHSAWSSCTSSSRTMARSNSGARCSR